MPRLHRSAADSIRAESTGHEPGHDGAIPLCAVRQSNSAPACLGTLCWQRSRADWQTQLLASGTTTVFHYRGNVTPPGDYDEWSALIRALASHVVDRYGIDEVIRM
jgi:Glycosyl hydrolases family 39